MLLLGVRGELTRVHSAFADPRVRWRLCASAALVSVNWLTYVWAIGNHRVVESSLTGFFATFYARRTFDNSAAPKIGSCLVGQFWGLTQPVHPHLFRHQMIT
jgi:hypothetical protein